MGTNKLVRTFTPWNTLRHSEFKAEWGDWVCKIILSQTEIVYVHSSRMPECALFSFRIMAEISYVTLILDTFVWIYWGHILLDRHRPGREEGSMIHFHYVIESAVPK